MDKFQEYEDEYMEFERIENPRHHRPDICAFIMLDELFPGTSDMVCAASHDEIFLDVDPEKLLEIGTDEQIRDLIRCGVHYDRERDSLAMFA